MLRPGRQSVWRYLQAFGHTILVLDRRTYRRTDMVKQYRVLHAVIAMHADC